MIEDSNISRKNGLDSYRIISLGYRFLTLFLVVGIFCVMFCFNHYIAEVKRDVRTAKQDFQIIDKRLMRIEDQIGDVRTKMKEVSKDLQGFDKKLLKDKEGFTDRNYNLKLELPKEFYNN